LNPINPGILVGIGGGKYQISDDVLALGLDARF
jgi:hypothetical protein